MGVFGTLISFGAGYAAGMKFGDKPVAAIRNAKQEAREKASTLAQSASSFRSRAMGESGGTIDVRTVREVMSSTTETVTQETTLADAARVMERANIGDVLIVDGTGQLRGIVTDRDIAIRAVAEGRDPNTTTVDEIMTPTVETISPSATVREAIETMRRHDIRRLPVVDGGSPIGVVSLGDLATSPGSRSVLADLSAAPPNN
ncbi:MAG: CBS domain-containing protein [Actinomycetota bacterium]